MMTMHVLGYGELVVQVLNAVSALTQGGMMVSLIKITALIGCITAVVVYLKQQQPQVFLKWLLMYVTVTLVVLTPKTSLSIEDVSQPTKAFRVDNVPTVFAMGLSVMTSIGFSVAQTFESLFSLPDDLRYTRTGMLFGSQLILASLEFHIQDADLKSDMNHYFRQCVVGDITLSRKYTLKELQESDNIISLITREPSPIRRLYLSTHKDSLSCLEATPNLIKRLDHHIEKNVLRVAGLTLFSPSDDMKMLFQTQMPLSFDYFQRMTDDATNIFRQQLMLNMIQEGVLSYQADTGVSQPFAQYNQTKSVSQHRSAWYAIAKKAVWFLPLLHTVLTLILIALFPLIILTPLATMTNVTLAGYVRFFVSLQCWPVLFAVLNGVLTFYGKDKIIGGVNLATLNSVDQLHHDLSLVAGYIMMFIPFLARGIVGNLNEAFSGLATALTSHMQGPAMGNANEVASGNFSLGQSSFYNTSANNLSANKHDTNWSDLQGQTQRQADSGVQVTQTGDGQWVYDASSTLSKLGFNFQGSEHISDSLQHMAEQQQQLANSDNHHYQQSLSQFSNQLLSASESIGSDVRVGHGASTTVSSQVQQAISRMQSTAEEVANRTGMSQEDALSGLTSAAIEGRVGVNSQHSLIGKTAGWLTGADGSLYASASGSKSSSSSERFHEGSEQVLSARAMQDFRDDLQTLEQSTQTEHMDTLDNLNQSQLSQASNELRQASDYHQAFQVHAQESERLSQAANFVKTNAVSINEDLTQTFTQYVSEQIGEEDAKALFTHINHPENEKTLDSLKQQFLSEKVDGLSQHYADMSDKVDVKGDTQKAALPEKKEAINQSHDDQRSKITSETPSKEDILSNANKVKVQASHRQHGVNDVVTKQKTDVDHKKGGIEKHNRDKLSYGEERSKTGLLINTGKTIVFKQPVDPTTRKQE